MNTESYKDAEEVLSKKQSEVAGKLFDFLHPRALSAAQETADEILATGITRNELVQLELDTTTPEVKPTFSDVIHLAIKYAKARASVMELPAFHTSLVLPAYGENRRILPRGTEPGQDPDGEDFINEKHKQLEWLFAGTPHTYSVTIVDDMSKPNPIRSGEAAMQMIEKYGVKNFNVLFLEDGVKNEKNGNDLVAKSLRGIEYPKNSKKAGAIYYGSAKVIEEYVGALPHVIFLTDCDLAINAVQLGSLAYPVIHDGAVAGTASRRVPGAVLEITSSRNIRANAARYFRELLFKGLLPKDTQCGAKVFKAEALKDVLAEGMLTLDYSYDIELLTKMALKFGADKVVPVPVAVFESAALTTTDSSVHFTIMKTQLHIAKELKLGSGPIFDQTVEISEILTSDNEIWLAYLEQLKDNPELIEKQNNFETDILPEVLKLAKGE